VSFVDCGTDNPAGGGLHHFGIPTRDWSDMSSTERPKRSKEWIESECLRVLHTTEFFRTAADIKIERHDDGRSHNWHLKGFSINPAGRVTGSSHPRLFEEALDAVRRVQEAADLE
jgi:hypothetical protein